MKLSFYEQKFQKQFLEVIFNFEQLGCQSMYRNWAILSN